MTTSRDPDRMIHAFLDEGEEQLNDRVYDAVRAEIEQKRQRVFIGPWRTPIMSKFVTFGFGAAAVVVIAVLVGAQLFGSPSNVGSGGELTPTPEATATESSSPPSVAWRPLPRTECAELEAGTYRAAIGAVSVTVSVPTGWKGSSDRDSFTVNSRGSCLFGGGVTLGVSLVSHVYSDACHWQGTAVETGTPAAVVAALAAQTGHRTSGPSETTLAGFPATRFEFSLPGDFDYTTCADDIHLWQSPGGGEGPGMYEFDGSGSFVTVYVVDVDGSALGIAVDSGVPDEPADVAELDAIVASLRIEP
jgi:hypothetical protein